jgi:hypothetical protein
MKDALRRKEAIVGGEWQPGATQKLEKAEKNTKKNDFGFFRAKICVFR